MLKRRAGAAVALLVVASSAARARASEDVQLGWIAPDEAVYAMLGRSLWETGSPSLLGEGGGFYSLVYPALVGPLLAHGDLASVARPLQVVQAIVMSTAAVVVYRWGRPLLGAGWAVLAAALTLSVPGLAYSGLLMTEVVLYPLSAAALWAIARALERPTGARQALAAGGIAAGVLTHPRMVALLPALVLAVALQCAFTRDLVPARRQLRLVAGLAGACAALVVASAAGHVTSVLGVYEAAVIRYDLGAAAADVLWHWAAAYVLVAGIPLVALALLLVLCLAGDERDPRAVALVCIVSAWTVCLVLEVGIFASYWVGHLAERDLLLLAPPLFLAFGLWLARGLPRPRAWTPLIALALATPAILLPVRRFAVQEAALDSFSFIPLWRLAEATSPGLLELTFSVAAAVLAAAATIVPRRVHPVLPVLVGGVLLKLAVTSSRELVRLSDDDQRWVLDRGDPGWVDDAADGRVTYLHSSALAAAPYKHVLWNRSIAEVVRLPEASGLDPLDADVVSPRFDGLLLREDGSRVGAGMLVLPTDTMPVGEQLATTGRATDLPGLALWRLHPPARIKLRKKGFHLNGDLLGNEAEVTVYGCGPGRLEVTLLGKAGTPVDVSVNGLPRVRRAVPSGEAETISVPGPADADGRAPCFFRFSSPGLTGSTRIEYVSTG